MCRIWRKVLKAPLQYVALQCQIFKVANTETVIELSVLKCELRVSRYITENYSHMKMRRHVICNAYSQSFNLPPFTLNDVLDARVGPNYLDE
jgi:hypothetical protein